MSEATSIDQFNEIAAAIFAKLYEHFPRQTGLTAKDILGIDLNEYPDPTQRPPELHMLSETIRWLNDAGYIWAQQLMGGEATARLTPQGLACLQTPPDPLQEAEPPVGQQISDALKRGARDTARDLTTKLLIAGGMALSSGLG